jgi:hypothetical protein
VEVPRVDRHAPDDLVDAAQLRLTWFVREAWPSPVTGTICTAGELTAGQELSVIVASDQLVLFGDGIETDSIRLSWGQSVTFGLASRTLRLVR